MVRLIDKFNKKSRRTARLLYVDKMSIDVLALFVVKCPHGIFRA
jgi:hypothetical protein